MYRVYILHICRVGILIGPPAVWNMGSVFVCEFSIFLSFPTTYTDYGICEVHETIQWTVQLFYRTVLSRLSDNVR